jgi:hypothetical protein
VMDPDFLQLEFHQFHAILDLNDPFQTRQFWFNIQFNIIKQSQPLTSDRTAQINYYVVQKILLQRWLVSLLHPTVLFTTTYTYMHKSLE